MTASIFDFKAIAQRMKELGCEKWIPKAPEKPMPKAEEEDPPSHFHFGWPFSPLIP